MKLTLPHWVGIALALAAIVIAQVIAEQSSGQLAIPAEALTVLVIASKVISLLNVSINPAANARAAIAAGDVVPLNVVQQSARDASTPAETPASKKAP